MQAIWDQKAEKLTVIGDKNAGQPRIWHITLRLRGADGKIIKHIYKPRGKCTIRDIIDQIRDGMLIEWLEDPSVQYAGFIAIAR